MLALVAVVLRAADFSDPVIHVDEQYYLLVGDRMWRGAVPYLDVWDRKPVGLFLLFAAFRLLPGDGVLAYQLAATGFAAATAWVVWRCATRLGVGWRGAIAVGVSYLLLLSVLGGRGGQSPVFYNLPVAVAGLMTLRLPDLVAAGRRSAIVASGATACLLAGVAIQMKYTPAIEGAFFGVAHLWALRRAGARPVVVIGGGATWLLAGLAPTLAAAGWYWHSGTAELDAWWFANITSIFQRAGYPVEQLAMRLLGIAVQLSALIAAAWFAWRWRPRIGVAGERAGIAFGWLGAATVGFLAIGTFFDHYALPLLAPLAVVAAPALDRSRRALVATLALALALFGVERWTAPDDAAGARAVAAVVRVNMGDQCPYVFIGDTATYLLADACLPTAYAFPNLLAYTTEQGATGIDEAGEVRRILAGRPPVIVASDRRLAIWNPGSVAALRAALRDYRPVFRTRRASWSTIVYLRRDLPLRPAR